MKFAATTVPDSLQGAPALPRLRSAAAWRRYGVDVFLPFLATRIALLLAGWFARYFPISPDYPVEHVYDLGWQYSPHRLIDIWGRWDSGWYMTVVHEGYALRGALGDIQSNISFFPVFPYMVRGLLWLIPDSLQTSGRELLTGVLLNNLLLLGALLLLHRLVQRLTGDLATAQRTVLYVLLFPAAIFYSTFYTESVFLFFAVATFYFAQQRAWGWAGIACAILALTRPLGILATPALGWLYLSSVQWRASKIRLDVLWLLAAPAALLLHLWQLYRITHDFFAPIRAQTAFDRSFTWPWQTLIDPVNPNILMTPQEQTFMLLFLVCAVAACFRLPSAGYGLFALALLLPPLFTGTLYASLRYIMVAFPALIILAQWGARPWVDRLIQPIFFALQILIMVAWSQFYWVA